MQGRIALARRGIDFAMQQVSSGASIFRKVINESIADVSELLLRYEDDEDHDRQIEPNENSDEEDNADDDVSQSYPVDMVIARAVDGEPLPSVHSEFDTHGSLVWRFPIDFSQGCVDGRSGSSACSLIALVIGQVIQDVEVPMEGFLSPLWTTMLYHAMVTGNNIYDKYRASLPARYLSAAEACDIFARNENFSLEPEEPLPVRLVDDHQLSPVASQLQLLAYAPSRKLALLTICEKTSLFVVHPPDIVYVDTHCHMPNAGAVVVVGRCDRLNDFCLSVWDIEGTGPNTFGNLVTLLNA